MSDFKGEQRCDQGMEERRCRREGGGAARINIIIVSTGWKGVCGILSQSDWCRTVLIDSCMERHDNFKELSPVSASQSSSISDGQAGM